MRLIDACALQEEYKARHSGKRLLLIDVAPTVDAVPVRHGQWIRTMTGLIRWRLITILQKQRKKEKITMKSAAISTV